MVRGTFSPARAWRLTVGPASTRTLGVRIYTVSLKLFKHTETLYRHICPVVVEGHHDRNAVHGTAVVVAPALALTAVHVIAGALEYSVGPEFLAASKTRKGPITARVTFTLLVRSPRTPRTEILRVTGVHPVPGTDVCILEFVRTARGRSVRPLSPYPALRWCGPEVGESVRVLGYPYTQLSSEGHRKGLLRLIPIEASGTVHEVHTVKRDSAVLNFPCFRTNAFAAAGMSGCPILDRQGRICGLLSSSLSTADEDDEPVSYGAILKPVTGLQIRPRPRSRRFALRLRRLLARNRRNNLATEGDHRRRSTDALYLPEEGN